MIMVSPVGGFGWVRVEDVDTSVGYGESFIEGTDRVYWKSYQCNYLGYHKSVSEMDSQPWSAMDSLIRSTLRE
jgi:hypothetical protein